MYEQKKQYRLFPEVPGQLGSNTQLDNSVHPPVLIHLHLMFDGWLGDEIIECFPCFLMAEILVKKIEQFNLTGYSLSDAEISISEIFKDLYPNREIPRFKWLIVGKDPQDDFFLDNENILNVSGRGIEILKDVGKLDYCQIEPII